MDQTRPNQTRGGGLKLPPTIINSNPAILGFSWMAVFVEELNMYGAFWPFRVLQILLGTQILMR